MAEYLYVPFPTKSQHGAKMSDVAVRADIQRAKNVTHVIVLKSNLSIWDNDKFDPGAKGHFIDKQGGILNRFKKGNRVLSVVGASDVLYVTGHGGGAKYPNLIGANMVKERENDSDLKGVKAITATTLAKRMKKEGLTTAIKNIAVIICDSGIDGNDGAVTRDCFAKLLAMALGGLGYSAVEVVGYTGELAASGAKTQIGTVTADDGGKYTLSNRCRIFNARGAEILG